MAIAHRGASSYAPENTMAAFDLAIVMGARHIELDVHSTSDGHDAVIAQARSLGLSQICPRANRITSELVRRLRAAGFVVRAWGVASEDLMRQVVQSGADGMTVNFPDKLIAYLATSTASRG